MITKEETNYLLAIFSTIGLTYFLYTPSSWTYIIMIPFLIFKNTLQIKFQLQLISILCLCASFFMIPYISQIFAVCALGLSVSVGCRINSKWKIWIIYFAQCLGILLRVFMNNFTKSSLSCDIILLFLTLLNLYMAQVSAEDKKDRNLWMIYPYFDKYWTYSLGIMIGFFLPFINFKKCYRFLAVSFIILIEIYLDSQFYSYLFSFARGIIVFDDTKHKSQLFFVLGSLRSNYMLIGYLILGIYIWQYQKKKLHQYQLSNPIMQIQLESRNSLKFN